MKRENYADTASLAVEEYEEFSFLPSPSSLEEYLEHIWKYQESVIFQSILMKMIENLRKSGFFVIPTREKRPVCRFETQQDKETANKMKIHTEASLIVPPWLAILDIETKDFLDIDWQLFATVETGKGYHIYVYREPWMRALKTPECEFRLGKNLLTILPGSRLFHEKLKKEVFYKVLNPKIYSFSDLPEKLKEWIHFQTERSFHLVGTDPAKRGSCGIDTEKIEQVVETVKDHYLPGRRQSIIFALSGYLRKAGWDEEEVTEVVRELHNKTGDTDPLKQRLSAVHESFRKEKDDLLGWSGLRNFLPEDSLNTLENIVKQNGDNRNLSAIRKKREKETPYIEFTLNRLCQVLRQKLIEYIGFIGYSPDLETWLWAKNSLVWEELTEEEFLVFLREVVEENFLKIIKTITGSYSERLTKFLLSFLQRGNYTHEILQTMRVLMSLPPERVFGFPALCLYSPSYKIEFSNPNKWIPKSEPVYQTFGADPEERLPLKFMEFLKRLLGDENRVEFFRRVLAYSLLPGAKRKIIFIVGETGTGKSTLATILQGVLGKYAGTLPKGVLIGPQSDNVIQPHFKILKNARLVFVSEVSAKDTLNSEKLKLITGGDVLSWRNPHSAVIHEVRPEALLMILCNSKPQFSVLDTAIAERVEYIYTRERIPSFQRKMNFAEEILATEKGAILNWILKALPYVQVHHYFWENSPFKIHKLRELVLKDLCTGLWEFLTVPDPEGLVELRELVEVSLQVLERLNLKESFCKNLGLRDEESLRKAIETRWGLFVKSFNPSCVIEKTLHGRRIRIVLGYRINRENLENLCIEGS